jgi:broad specificity phosphatase PhoE
MARLFLVRHGQASFGQANYDQLSPVGHQQATWLGEYFTEREVRFARAVAGSLVRQQETAQGILAALPAGSAPSITTHAGLNEYDGESLYRAATGGRDVLAHQRADYRDYWRTLKAAMHAWAADTLTGEFETWGQFGQRTRAALEAAATGLGADEAALVVSSGGALSRALIDILHCPAAMAVEFNLQYRNSAVTELIVGSRGGNRGGNDGGSCGSSLDGARLVSFNTITHLDQSGRRGAITFA